MIKSKTKELKDEIDKEINHDFPIIKELKEIRRNAKIKISDTDFSVLCLGICGMVERYENNSRIDALNEVQELIRNEYKFHVIDAVSRDILLEEVEKLK